MQALDLFSGGGGLSYGFEQAGIDVVASVDRNEKALETIEANSVSEPIQIDLGPETDGHDINDAASTQLLDVDVVMGGPPCQDFSKANRNVDEGRENSVIDFARIATDLRPTVILLENVRQIATKNDGAILEAYKSWLETEGYVIGERTLDAADYGVPQHRLRMFVLAIREEVHEQWEDDVGFFPRPICGPDSDRDDSLVTAGEALAPIDGPDDPDEYAVTSKHADLLPDVPPGLNYHFYTERLGHPDPKFGWRSRFSDFLYKADPEKPVRTLKANPGSANGPFHWENRRFTESELAALHSFPTTYEFPHGYTETQRQIGNAVPPRQATQLARGIQRLLGQCGKPMLEPDEKLNFHSRRRTSTEEYERKARDRLIELGLLTPSESSQKADTEVETDAMA